MSCPHVGISGLPSHRKRNRVLLQLVELVLEVFAQHWRYGDLALRGHLHRTFVMWRPRLESDVAFFAPSGPADARAFPCLTMFFVVSTKVALLYVDLCASAVW